MFIEKVETEDKRRWTARNESESCHKDRSLGCSTLAGTQGAFENIEAT
jgi:hypothetical protein